MSTRDRLLVALAAKSVGARVSGEKLAKSLGISRTMVCKHIHVLRDWGFPIQGTSRSGYQIAAPIDLSLWHLAQQARPRSWIQPHHFFSTASTQTLAKVGAEMGLAEGNLWMAEQQTAGRGRLSRPWASGYGGLWMSWLLRPKVAPVQVPSITQVAALTLAQLLQRKTKHKVRLKWPNDVVYKTPQGWRKLAGFLTDMSAEMDRTHWVVIGLGLNVNNMLPAELRTIGLSLHDLTGRYFARAELLEEFLSLFQRAYQRWVRSGFEPFQRSYWELYRAPDEAVRLQTSQGLVLGQARGVDASGALIVESRRQIQHLLEGEIVL